MHPDPAFMHVATQCIFAITDFWLGKIFHSSAIVMETTSMQLTRFLFIQHMGLSLQQDPMEPLTFGTLCVMISYMQIHLDF
jgi:hypothetical protein